MLARFPAGMVALEHIGTGWSQMPGLLPFTDAAGFDRPTSITMQRPVSMTERETAA